jgi:hypothetical protein
MVFGHSCQPFEECVADGGDGGVGIGNSGVMDKVKDAVGRAI